MKYKHSKEEVVEKVGPLCKNVSTCTKKIIILIILFFVGACCLVFIGKYIDLNTVHEYRILNETKYTSNENTAIYELVVVDSINQIKHLYLTEETYNDKVNKNIIALELKDYKRNQELL